MMAEDFEMVGACSEAPGAYLPGDIGVRGCSCAGAALFLIGGTVDCLLFGVFVSLGLFYGVAVGLFYGVF
jgi:hypothetical protein